MIGNIIEEYLVKLGADVDTSSFAKMDGALEQAGAGVQGLAGQWVKAGTVISGVLTAVVGSVVGLVTNTAKQDLAMQKYASSMMITTQQAYEMKHALDALGESAADVQMNPELRGRYDSLVADARQMMPGADFSAEQKQIRDILFEFTRLKQEVTYILKWIGYYIAKDFAGPLSTAGKTLHELNDYIIHNIPRISRTIADGFGYLINIAINFVRAIFGVGKALDKIWDSFPPGVKKAIVAITALGAVIKATPLGRMMMLLSGVLLLIDDFFGYLDGKDSALGPYWQKLIDWWFVFSNKVDVGLKSIQKFWDEINGDKSLETFVDIVQRTAIAVWDLISAVGELAGSILDSLWAGLKDAGIVDSFSDMVNRAGDAVHSLFEFIINVIDAISSFIRTIARSEAFKGFVQSVGEIIGSLWDLITAILTFVKDILVAFYDALGDNGAVDEFGNSISDATLNVKDIVKALSQGIRYVASFFREAGKSEAVRSLVRLLADFLKILWDIISAIISLAYSIIRDFIKELESLWGIFKDLEVPQSFNEMLHNIIDAFIELFKGAFNLVRILVKLLKYLVGDPRITPFWHNVGRAFGELTKMLIGTLNTLGKIGKVIGLLLQGKFKEAAAMFGFGGDSGGGNVGEVGESAGETVEGFVRGGMTEIAAAALVGNMTAESGLNPNTEVVDSNGLVSSGMAQWNGSRSDALKEYATERGKDWTDKSVQMEFAIYELKTKYQDVWERINAASSVREASDILLHEWEKPEDQSVAVEEYRASLSESAMQKYKETMANKPQITITPDIPEDSPDPDDGGIDSSSVGSVIKSQYDAVVNGISSIGSKVGDYISKAMPSNSFVNARDSLDNQSSDTSSNNSSISDLITYLKNKVQPVPTIPGLGYAFASAPSNTYTNSNVIGDVNVYVTNTNATAVEIGTEVVNGISDKLNMPKRPIVNVRDKRGVIG